MTRAKLTMSFLGVCLIIIVGATAGQAAPRTFVSGSGSDANAPGCTFTAPCRFLNTAYANTDIGGEIIALTPAGYGGLAITHSITVQTVPGVVGFIGVVASSAGISVAAGPSDVVIIRNFQFSGSPALAANSVGVNHTGGKLIIDSCVFTQLATGVNVVNAKADIIDSDFYGNTTGISCDGLGTEGTGGSVSTAQIRLNGGNVTANATGVIQKNAGSNKNNVFSFTSGNSGSTNVIGNTTDKNCTGVSCNSSIPGFSVNGGGLN